MRLPLFLMRHSMALRPYTLNGLEMLLYDVTGQEWICKTLGAKVTLCSSELLLLLLSVHLCYYLTHKR